MGVIGFIPPDTVIVLTSFKVINNQKGILSYRGSTCRPNGSFFLQELPRQKIPVAMSRVSFFKILKNLCVFVAKSLEMSTYFLKTTPGYGYEF